MTDDKVIRIDPVTRLEGHGSLTIVLSKDGKKVKDVQYNINKKVDILEKHIDKVNSLEELIVFEIDRIEKLT